MGLVAVHTGAGNFVIEENYKILCKRSSKKACDLLDSGNGTVMDAVELAIKMLEDNPNTNAGFGSNLTWEGHIECEAGIMDSITSNFGACTCINDVKNPISLARKICDKQSSLFPFGRLPPMVVCSSGASILAKEFSLEIVNESELISRKAQNTYDHYKRKISEYEQTNAIQVSRLDTVGAVAIDDYGNVASGCSSGGILLKLPGRIGQSAAYGAGCWSQKINNQSLCCVTTGNGEYIMKTLLAREICTNLINNESPTTKLYQVFNDKFLKSTMLPRNQEKYAGCLVIDYNSELNRGDLLWAHSTKVLCLGYKLSSQKTAKFVSSLLPDQTSAGHKVIVGGISF